MQYPLLRQYELQEGLGGVFGLPDGGEVRLEPRENAVVVGWTTREHFVVTAARIGQFATEANEVVLIKDGQLKESRLRSSRLGGYIARNWPYELIRVENGDSTLVYEKSPDEPDAELSLVANNWDHAAELATELSVTLTNTAEFNDVLSELVLKLQA